MVTFLVAMNGLKVCCREWDMLKGEQSQNQKKTYVEQFEVIQAQFIFDIHVRVIIEIEAVPDEYL